MYKKLMYVVAVLLITVGGARAAVLEISLDAPVPGAKDIANLVGSASDVNNIAGVVDGVYDNDFATYIAHDRGSQGQTFVTGAEDVVMTGVWVRHVLYTTEADTTWYSMQPGSQLLVRVTDPAASGTDAFVLASETYDVTGEEENALPADTTNDATGTGKWVHLTLDAPVTLAANTEYGFDITSVSGLAGVMFFETMGIKDDADGGNPYADGAAYVTGAAGVADNNLAPAAGDRVFVVEFAGPTGPVASYSMEGDIADGSGNGLDGTLIGDPNFVEGVIGQALDFDGVDDNVELPIGSLVGSLNDCTIATWVNWTGQAAGAWQRIWDFGTGTDVNMFLTTWQAWSYTDEPAGTPRFAIKAPQGEGDEQHTTSADPMPEGWHHVVVTIDPGNTTHTLLIDGEVVAQNTEGSWTPSDLGETTQNYIGKAQWPDPLFVGMMDEFQIYDRVLSAGELNALMATGVVPTHLYTFEDGTAADSVGSANGVLVGGAAIAGGAMVTTDQDQWMEMPGDVIAMNTYAEVTVEAFYTPTAGANASWSMLAYFGDSTDPDPTAGVGNDGFFITSARGDDVSRAAISVGDPASPWAAESGANGPEYDDGLPHQMASTINATDITLTIDGALIASTPLDPNNNLAGLSTNYALLAKGGYGGDPEWIGEIEEFRIYNRALSEDALAASYAAGPIKVGPVPIDPGTDGLIAHYPLDSAGRSVTADVSGNGLDGAVVGDPEFVPGVVGQALDCDGDGDYVDCGNNPLFDVTDAITVATWVNIRSIPQAWTAVITKGDAAWRISNNSSSMGMHFGFEDGSRGWQAANSATELIAGEWSHVCGVYDINVGAKIYINGVEDGSNPDTEGITISPWNVYIAANQQTMENADPRYFDGQLDEVMIYDRPLSALEVAYLAGL